MGFFSSKSETPRDPAPRMKFTPLPPNSGRDERPQCWCGGCDDEDED